MKYFLIVLFTLSLLTSCNSNKDKEYMDQAVDNQKKNNISQAVTNYEKLINEYPESEFVPEALFELATLYQNKMIKNIEPVSSLRKASTLFKSIHQKYPDHKKAPMALFMSGFINANELNNYKEATEIYNLFLKEYPKHELAVSAKQELETMGLNPEEILKDKANL